MGIGDERAQLRSNTLSLCDLLKRFLIFGNRTKRLKCLALNVILRNTDECIRAIDTIVEFAAEARCSEMEPLMYAYARLAHRPGQSTDAIRVRKYAFRFLPVVCSIPTHLFMFLSHGTSWGEIKKDALRQWYMGMGPQRLAFLVTKYPHRQGWRHRDALALMHLKHTDLNTDQRIVLQYVKDGSIKGDGDIADYLRRVQRLRNAQSSDEAVACIEESRLSNGPNLVVEHVPNCLLCIDTWKSMLDFTGLKRLISSVHLLTNLGMFDDHHYVDVATRMMSNQEQIRNSRMHPMTILVAWRTYTRGTSAKGRQTWNPHPDISNALEAMFYASFQHMKPTGLSLLYALDISGSMAIHSTKVGLSCLEVMMCFVMALLRVETSCKVVAFCHELIELDIDKGTSLNDLMALCGPGGSTDCCLAFDFARSNREKYDGIVMWTDNDHNGKRNPKYAIDLYRDEMNTKTKAVVVAMDGNDFNLLPKDDPLSLNLAGGDAAMAQQLNAFLCI